MKSSTTYPRPTWVAKVAALACLVLPPSAVLAQSYQFEWEDGGAIDWVASDNISVQNSQGGSAAIGRRVYSNVQGSGLDVTLTISESSSGVNRTGLANETRLFPDLDNNFSVGGQIRDIGPEGVEIYTQVRPLLPDRDLLLFTMESDSADDTLTAEFTFTSPVTLAGGSTIIDIDSFHLSGNDTEAERPSNFQDNVRFFAFLAGSPVPIDIMRVDATGTPWGVTVIDAGSLVRGYSAPTASSASPFHGAVSFTDERGWARMSSATAFDRLVVEYTNGPEDRITIGGVTSTDYLSNSHSIGIDGFEFSVVPEPSSALLLAVAGIALLGLQRHRPRGHSPARSN